MLPHALLLAVVLQGAEPRLPGALTSTDPHNRHPATLANGEFGATVGPFGLHPEGAHRFRTVMAGIWNGPLYTDDGWPNYQLYYPELPAPAKLALSWQGEDLLPAGAAVTGYSQELHLGRSVLTTSFTRATKDGPVRITVLQFASRARPELFVTSVEVAVTAPGVLAASAALDLTNTRGVRWVASRQRAAEGRHALRLRTLVAETESLDPYDIEVTQSLRAGSGAVAGQSDDRITLSSRTSVAPDQPGRLLLLTTYRSSRRAPLAARHDFDPLAAASAAGLERLLAEHEAAWRELWRSRVEVDGEPAVQDAADAALWNLVSSVRPGGDDSISPMGLSKVDTNHYGGHVFWDAETWMYPPLLLLHPELARSMLEYRFTRLEGARQNAILKGATDGTPWHSEAAWYPWESARTGQEACPRWFVAGDEIHNNACIALAFWQFAQVHGDEAFVRTRAAPVTSGIARFYAARVRKEADGRYHLRGVTGADEYAERKDDFPYVNGSARRALEIAGTFARASGLVAPAEWAEVAAGLVVPFDAEHGIHPEYEGYDGRTIKQADVVLMSYPWGIVTEPARVRADLEFYEPRTAQNAPAMSAAIHTVLWAQLREPEKSAAAFRKAWVPNVKGPFLAWSETPGNDCISFTTGMGGFLQALVNGFGGIRVVEGGLEARPFLPPGWSALRVRGITLGAGTVDLLVERDGARVVPASGKPDLARFRLLER